MKEPTYTPYLRKKRSDDAEGYITIRKVHNRKSTHVSLGILLPERNWDEHKCRVKTRVKESEQYNNRIEQEIAQMKKASAVPQKVKVKQKSEPTVDFLFEDYIGHLNRMNKHATAHTVIATHRHLSMFWGAGKGVMHVSDINSILVRDFEAYLRGRLNMNSAKKYVAVLRRVFKEGKIHGTINCTHDPFLSFKATRVPTKRDYLTKNEVERLMNLDLSEYPKLINTRRQFLFQLFAQGLRVSDLMTLRWGNYISGDLQFVQFKTKNAHRVILNKHSMRILGEVLPEGIDDLLQMKFRGIDQGEPCALTYDDWHEHYRKREQSTPQAYARGNQNALRELETHKTQLDGVIEQFIMLLHHRIRDHAQLNPNQFIFDMLPASLFAKIKFNESTALSKLMYDMMKSRTAYYNNQLRQLQGLLGIEKGFSSHMMRCTYASLLIDETQTECYAISKLLGHRRVSTTEQYIVNTLRKRQDVASERFGEIFL